MSGLTTVLQKSIDLAIDVEITIRWIGPISLKFILEKLDCDRNIKVFLCLFKLLKSLHCDNSGIVEDSFSDLSENKYINDFVEVVAILLWRSLASSVKYQGWKTFKNTWRLDTLLLMATEEVHKAPP